MMNNARINASNRRSVFEGDCIGLILAAVGNSVIGVSTMNTLRKGGAITLKHWAPFLRHWP